MLTTLLHVTLALALVLTLRRPTQRLFGATPAFTLWLLPPLMALLPCLPNTLSPWPDTMPVLVFPVTRAFAAGLTTPASSMHWSYLLWAVGASLGLLRLASGYWRLLRDSTPLPSAMRRVLEAESSELDLRRVHLHPAGPALLWAPRSLLLLPADFLDRFDARQRRLVLQHETTHLRRGDALWSLLGELAAALLWFHPLVWLALPRMRLDQELACDERVLRQSPHDETDYAHTLLHSTGVNVMPISIPWLAQPQLKERLTMIQRPRPGTLRRHIGFAVLAALISGTTFITQAAAGHDQQTSPAYPDKDMVTQRYPSYPADAIKNKEQGTVVLRVLVGVDGKPVHVTVEATTKAAPDLIKAANDTVMGWHFTPAMKDGKPVEAYVRVPFKFNLSAPAPSSSAASPAA